MSEHLIWQNRFEDLRSNLQGLYERTEWAFEEQPELCISEAREFFVSHDLQVADNEAAAKKYWGDRYFRVVRVDNDKT